MSRRTWGIVLVALAGCGDNTPATRGFVDVIGRNDLGARGMNSAIAIAGDTAYIGSRIDNRGIAILDISDPSEPTQIGEIPGVVGMSSRELRAVADANVLAVLSMRCDPALHGCSLTGGETESIKLYDISNRAAPVLAAMYPIVSTRIRQRSPHEMYLRRDGDRILLFVSTPPAGPELEVIDISDPYAPVQFTSFGQGLGTGGSDDILHSVSLSNDGSRVYISHQLGGLLVADATALPAFSLITQPGTAFDFAPPAVMGPHSTVEVPGRDVLLVTEEVYPPPYGTGCPWGKLRIVDAANPAAPVLLSEFGLPENDPAICASSAFERVAFTAHNATATHDLAFVTWYAGGLQVLDISDPVKPRQLVDLRPEPLPAVAVEDPGLGGSGVEMWSYPIIKDGFVYVVDARNGLYVLRYSGVFQEQVLDEDFLEGNSNL